MARTDQTNGRLSAGSSDKAIWEYCRSADAEPDEAARFLDLAGFADALLDDEDERERVAVLLAGDPDAAADIAAARALASHTADLADEAVIARAAALIEPRGEVVPFPRPVRPRASFFHLASWGSLAAGIVAASWLGFALGSDASLAFGPVAQPNEDSSFLSDLIDPTGGVLHTINDGLNS